jgi:hypothetical protein
MKHCLQSGCPWECGTYRSPSCSDRFLYYALLIAFVSALLASLGAGISSLVMGSHAAAVPELVKDSTPGLQLQGRDP